MSHLLTVQHQLQYAKNTCDSLLFFVRARPWLCAYLEILHILHNVSIGTYVQTHRLAANTIVQLWRY